jgi:hypothetical protein
MTTENWQKSSFSGNSGNCVHIGATGEGAIKLRESDAPETVLTTTPEALGSLIRRIKSNRTNRSRS